jgi:PAS domain S-box-containing protein
VRDLAVGAAGVGVFDWDLVTGVLSWDDRLLELFEYDRDTFGGTIEAFDERVHPDDLPRVTLALQRAIETVGEYEAEYRIVVPHGGLRWIGARGQAIGGADGRAIRVIGAAYDTTVHREGDARVVEVLEAMPAAFFSLDTDWRFAYVNAEAEKLLGHSREELLGQVIWELFPAAVGSDFETHYRHAMRERQPVSFDAHYPEPLNAWYDVRAWPSPTGLSVYFLEVTQRRAAEEEAARAAARAALIAEVNQQLGETLDPIEAVGRFTRLMVPTLADWCLVTVIDRDRAPGDWRRTLRDVGWSHASPEGEALVATYARTRLDALTDDAPIAIALRTGRPVIIPRDANERFTTSLQPGPAQEVMAELAPDSAVVIPLRGRDQPVGLLTLYNGAGRPPLAAEDLQTVLDAAARAGLALDNARLYAEQRQLAEQLQRALLTAPPEPDHVEIVVRYEPAAQVAQIGGDWYDAFLQQNGSTVLVIGDVVGHDSAAAAAMGQVRSLLRGIAAHTGDGPAAVLQGLDRTMRTLLIETTATAVVARIEQTEDERLRGVAHLRWSNAGHPPPMVINPDGGITVLADVGADLLLGVDPNSPRTESTITVDRGATILLYTDGLVERRDQPLAEGLVRLRDTLMELGRLPLEELCDRILERLLPARRSDDVALVAVRLHRQDRPRPPEAGPNRVPDVVPGAAAVQPDAG